MKKLSIRFIVSLGGVVSYQGLEKDKKGEFVFYEFDTIEALRLIDADYATPKSKADYEKAKANIQQIQDEADEKQRLIDNIENINELKLRKEALELELAEVTANLDSAENAINGESGDKNGGDPINLDELLTKYKDNENIVDGLKAPQLEALCVHFKLEYTNDKTAKKDLKALEAE